MDDPDQVNEFLEPIAKPRGFSLSSLPFSVKIALHIAMLILLTGLAIGGFAAHQYRIETATREQRLVHTVYAAVANHISAHFLSHTNSIDAADLDRFLGGKLLRIDGKASGAPTHRPDHIVLYGPGGDLVYEFNEPGSTAPRHYPTAMEVAKRELVWKDTSEGRLAVLGPVIPEDELLGMLYVSMPSGIQRGLGDMFRDSLGVLLMVLCIAVIISLAFAAQSLRPVGQLARAAIRVSQGDTSQQVPIRTHDEIGELTGHFNAMTTAIGQRLNLMQRLQEGTVRISRELERDRLLEVLADIFTRLAETDGFRLYLYDQRSHELEVVVDTNSRRLPEPSNDQLALMAFRERWTSYRKSDGAMNSEPGDVKELAIPLLSGKHRIGVIRLGAHRRDFAYEDEMITILSTLAQSASVSLDNADLYKMLSEKERIERDMKLARDIQTAMLPHEVPAIPGYAMVGGSIPAYEVGGDYYDYVQAGDRCFVVIADVSGKGMPAALIMNIVRSLFHTFAESEMPAAELIKKVNRTVTKDIEPESFVTLSAIELKPATHEACLVRAGHEPVLVAHASGEVVHHAPHGPALGMLNSELFDPLIKDVNIRIAPGDTLLLYTDGITEARNAEEEEFGLARLEQVLRSNPQLDVNQLYQKIIAEVNQFSAGVPQNDDITLVILRRLVS